MPAWVSDHVPHARNLPNVFETTSGLVRGYRDQAVVVLRGVPYGQAPEGALRFLPATSPTPWRGVLDATYPGPASPQLPLPGSYTEEQRIRSRPDAHIMGLYESMSYQSEDCLTLNVWAPASAPTRPRPVFVRFHGGGFASYSANTAAEDGTALAAQADVVVVTVNHRLGVLGYLYLGDIADERYEAGNAGNLDLVLALEWVRDNIAQFGGDPSNVMVSGCSGGAKKISHLLAMPTAVGLFHKAAIESGALHTAIERDAATDYTLRFLEHLGLDRTRVSDLNDVPAAEIVKTQHALKAAGLDAHGSYGGAGGPQPLVDGITLPEHPGAAVAAGASSDIPLIIGSNLDEAAGPSMRDVTLAVTWETLRDRLVSGEGQSGTPPLRLGERVDEVIDHYRAQWPTLCAGELALRIEAAGTWRRETTRFAELKAQGSSAPVWAYLFTWQSGAHDGFVKATHGLQVPMVMRNLDRGGAWTAESPDSQVIGEIVSEAWLGLAERGDPTHERLNEWSPFTPVGHETLLLDTPPVMAIDPFGDSNVLGWHQAVR